MSSCAAISYENTFTNKRFKIKNYKIIFKIFNFYKFVIFGLMQFKFGYLDAAMPIGKHINQAIDMHKACSVIQILS